jgi:hypothetical protein
VADRENATEVTYFYNEETEDRARELRDLLGRLAYDDPVVFAGVHLVRSGVPVADALVKVVQALVVVNSSLKRQLLDVLNNSPVPVFISEPTRKGQ